MHDAHCAPHIEETLNSLDELQFSKRLWEKDPDLWAQGPDAQSVVKNRLGWLEVVPTMRGRLDEIAGFAEEIRAAGFTHAVLIGMGGSSLSAHVSRLVFGAKPGYPDLRVLDSTVPATILETERLIDPVKTLFIVSTKSGTTVETLSTYRYFFERIRAAKSAQAGEAFTAITDPGTLLEREAAEKGFRRVFLNPPDVGGRYSALSYFGLVPAAVMGADIAELLDRASRMMSACGPSVSARDNPGAALGALMAECAAQGRDKLTLILSPEIASFGCWIEQLVAESTGKNGTGIIPIKGEPLGGSECYGNDRVFVYLRLEKPEHGDLDTAVEVLEKAGHPVVRLPLRDIYDLGQEYFRWEIATAAACALLGVNAFDEPNVEESKDNTKWLLDKFKQDGALPVEEPVLEENGIKLYCDEWTPAGGSLCSCLAAHLNRFQPGDYFALTAFLHPSPALHDFLQRLRMHLRDTYSAATTLGYGPRFLHSTGQLHKGGPGKGIFIQFTADDAEDIPVPGEGYSFGILKQAQALGDSAALRARNRPLIRLHIGKEANLEGITLRK